ncbi:reverse transcriptase [Tanacetum coccineum]
MFNRPASTLPRLVQETQFAFVSERMITDNAIIAFKVFHWLKNIRNGTKGSLAVKLDTSKAYDRAEWLFISLILKRMRFPPHFVRLLMACISTLTFSFNINGKVQGDVTPIRGPNFLVCKQIRIGTVLKFDFLRSTCACKWLLGIMSVACMDLHKSKLEYLINGKCSVIEDLDEEGTLLLGFGSKTFGYGEFITVPEVYRRKYEFTRDDDRRSTTEKKRRCYMTVFQQREDLSNMVAWNNWVIADLGIAKEQTTL